MTLTVLLIGLVLMYIIAIIVLDNFIFRKLKMSRRVLFHSIMLFILISIMFTVTVFSEGEIAWETFIMLILFSLVISILGGMGQYLNLMFINWRVRRLREKYSKLPDSPRKQNLLRMLDKLEGKQSKDQ